MTAALHRVGLKVLVASTALAAIASLAVSASDLVSDTDMSDYPTLLGLCLLVVAGSLLRSPHGPTQGASLSSVVLVSVYVIAGPAAAVVVTAVGSLAQARGVPLIKRVFNSSQRILAASVAAVTYIVLDAPVGDTVFDEVPLAIVGVTSAGVAHQLVNALLMSSVLWLERGRSVVRAFFKQVVLPTALPLLGYGFLGVMLAVVWLGGLGMVAGLVTLAPLLVARWALSQDEAERRAQSATMQAFIQVIEAKDFYTRGHSERVSQGVGMLGRHLQLPEDRQHALENAGLLHDCGKVGVPTSTLRKQGKLDDTEWDAIRLHPARGVELIGDIPFLEEVKSAVLHHHEKYDGTGYPAGLSGKKIPYFARMIGIVDAFDCLTSTRPYRPARGVEETLGILVQDKYTHFDPDLVDAFVDVVRRHGWVAEPAAQPVPDPSVPATIDHDDLSLGSGGGATGSAAGPA